MEIRCVARMMAAEVAFTTAAGDPHKKAVSMVRQSLDAAYADAAVHASGLTSLQSREEKGAATHEVQANLPAPAARPEKKP